MDVPAPSAGIIGEVRIKVGDKVSAGSVIATFVGADAASAAPTALRPPPQLRLHLQRAISMPRCL